MALAPLRHGKFLALTQSSLRSRTQPMVPRASALMARSFATSKNVEQQVKEVVAAEVKLKSGELQNNARFVRDLHVNRAGLRRLRMKFQNEFGKSIPEEDVNRMVTIQDTVNYFAAHS